MKNILTFHPNLRRYLEELMSDPNPQGQAFLTLAMLNNASIRYRDGLLDANPGCAGMPLGVNCQEVVCRFEPGHRGNSTNAAVRPVPVVVMLPAM